MRIGHPAALALTALCVLYALAPIVPHARAEPGPDAPHADALPDTVAYIGPRMQVDEPVFDFGQVEQGEQVTHAFRFANQGNRDLRVQSIKTSCGCTAAVLDADTLPPGTAGHIQATFDTARFAGHKAKNIRVHTNDPFNPVTTLTLQGEITTEVQVQPAQLYLGRLQRGTPIARPVTVLYDTHQALEITGITNGNPALRVRAEDARVEGKKGKTLHVSVSATAPRGLLKDTITITTTSLKKPTLTIPVVGSIEGDILVSPSQVSFGVVHQGIGETRTVHIKNRAARPLGLGPVRSSLDSVTPELTETTPGKEFALQLRLTGDAAPGRIRGSIEVVTDHPEETPLTIPLFGLVAAAPPATPQPERADED